MSTTSTSNTTSGAIHFSGLGNGVDFSSIIDSVIQADSYQVNQLTSWKKDWTDKQTALNTLNTNLLSLQTSLTSLGTMDGFMSKSASSSDSTLVTATANSQADDTSHSVDIHQVAQSDVWIGSVGEAATTTDITGSTSQNLSFTYSNANINISVAAGTTLQGLVDQINNDSSSSGAVKASTIFDGSAYHLQLTGRNPGAGHAIQLTGLGFGNYTPAGFENTRKAQNAQIRMDNYPPARNDVWSATTNESAPALDITGGAPQNFSFTAAGTNVSLALAAGTTLQGLSDQINSDPTAASLVKASVVNDANGYHLQLASLGKGESNAITLTGGFGNYTPSAFTNTTPAQSWLERQSNSISDAIPGVTLNLLKTTTPGAPENISVSTDTTKMKDNINTVVTQVNNVLTEVQSLTKVTTSGSKSTSSILTGNYGVQDLVGSQIQNLLVETGLGFSYYDSTTHKGDLYSTLAQVGVTTDADESSSTNGLLTVDSTTLDNALSSNAGGVAKLFAAVNIGNTDTANFSYASSITGISKPGAYKVDYSLWPGGVEKATMNGHPATVSADGKSITGSAGYPESGITVNVTNMSGSSGSGTVFLKQGKIGELMDSLKGMTDTTSGPLHILVDNYQSIVDNIDTKISNEQARLTLKKQNLTDQYSKLDALLGKYQNIQTAMTSQIAQLGTST